MKDKHYVRAILKRDYDKNFLKIIFRRIRHHRRRRRRRRRRSVSSSSRERF